LAFQRASGVLSFEGDRKEEGTQQGARHRFSMVETGVSRGQ
jgi:hypothetical protein